MYFPGFFFAQISAYEHFNCRDYNDFNGKFSLYQQQFSNNLLNAMSPSARFGF